MSEPIRTALVDDHPLWREGVASILNSDAAFEVIGQGSSADEAVQLAHDLLPDLMLLDVSMDGGGVNAAQRIATEYPVIKLVMLTVSQEEETVLAALKAGAKGYVLKGVSGTELIRIIKGVHAGETYITPTLATSILVESKKTTAESDPMTSLTKREHDILTHVAQGLSNRSIAEELHLSEKTVKHYMTNILQKLQVSNRVQAALIAQKTIHR